MTSPTTFMLSFLGRIDADIFVDSQFQCAVHRQRRFEVEVLEYSRSRQSLLARERNAESISAFSQRRRGPEALNDPIPRQQLLAADCNAVQRHLGPLSISAQRGGSSSSTASISIKVSRPRPPVHPRVHMPSHHEAGTPAATVAVTDRLPRADCHPADRMQDTHGLHKPAQSGAAIIRTL